jgi:hypothetical protein
MMPSSPHIACPIDLFDGCEAVIARLTASLNRATPQEKGRLAGELLETVSQLLDCSAYDRNNVNCNLCRQFSTLRRKTASLIVKATGRRHNRAGGNEE